MSGSPEVLDECFQHETFSRASTAAKKRNEVTRREQMSQRLSLFLGERRGHGWKCVDERTENADSFRTSPNYFPLTRQDMPRCDIGDRTPITKIFTPSSGRLQAGDVQIIAP